ncbi:MAG: MBL fold metallo-hydrolase [Campylobacterales bacterium]|nr:MBL fold metallo-hydrolase [Campylobacterales bacterium]
MWFDRSGKVLFIAIGFFVTLLYGAEAQSAAKKEARMNHPVITVVFDNNPYKKGLQSGWGFSCLIEGMEKNVLFDTGAEGTILLENMQKLGITPEGIDVLVLSHAHSDHTGGVYDLLQKNNRLTVYLPASFPENFKRKAKEYGADIIEVKQPVEIIDGVYSTGEMDAGIKEQALILRTPQGMVIITGCAHPGIVNIIKRAKALFGEEVLLVMRGFHLHNKTGSEIKRIISEIQKLGVRYVAPCHCSGERARDLFREAYGEQYLPVGVGKIIDTKALK